MPTIPEWAANMGQRMMEQRASWDSQDKVIIGQQEGLDENGLLLTFTPAYNPYFVSTDVAIANIADGDMGILQKTYTSEETAEEDDFKHYFPVDGKEDAHPEVFERSAVVDENEVQYGVHTRINYSSAEKQNLRDRLGYSPDFNVANHIEDIITGLAQDAVSTNIADRFACQQILQSGYKAEDLAAFTTVEGPQAAGAEFATTTTQTQVSSTSTNTEITTTEVGTTTFGVMSTQSETGY
jgi:hypothetical protein